MGVETEKYIRKPLYVDAVRVTAQNFDEIVAWCQGEVQTDEVPGQGTTKKYIKVRVHNPKNPRQTKAFIGDWILYTERGYKVYTNKAFRDAFDVVEDSVTTPPTPIEAVTTPQIPKFYFDPESDELTEHKPGPHAHPLTLQELMNIVRNELIGEELKEVVQRRVEELEESADNEDEGPQLTEDTAHGADVVASTPITAEVVEDEVESLGPIGPPPTPAIVPPEPGMEPLKHEPVFSQGGGGPVYLDDDVAQEKARPVTEQSPNVAAEGKRVLSEEEQRQMGQDEVRELLRTGDVVLAQDLVEQ